MKTNAPSVFGRFRVFKNGVGSVGNEIAVVIPNHNVFVPKARAIKGRTEIFFQEVALFLCRVNTGLPSLGCHWFVLNGHPPHRNSLGFVCLNEFHEVICPSLPVLRQEFTALEHVIVGFHEGRRAPGAGIENKVLINNRGRLFDHWNSFFQVLFNGKTFEAFVAFLNVCVAAQTKVTAVDAGADDVVIDSFF